jgi:hypothetical protein
MQAVAGIGTEKITSTVIATRGERLALCRTCIHGPDQQPGAFQIEFLSVVEIDSEERIMAGSAFDLDDIDAAFKDLDDRYLAGEAAAHTRTWSAIARIYANFNRHELPDMTPDSVFVDHRPLVTTEAEDLATYLRGVWDLVPDAGVYIEAVHRLSDLGAVITHAARGTSQEGFHAEWRLINISIVEDDRLDRSEIFDETDIDAALARFAEFDRPAPLADNAATQIWARLAEVFNRRDLDAFLALCTENLRYEDRRRGLRDEFEGAAAQRKAVLAMFEATPRSIRMTAEPIAVRGSRLALVHVCYRDTDYSARPITVEMMQIVEASDGGLLHNSVSFDPDDIDAAFQELETRFIAGEAAAYADTWTRITRAYEGLNRRELPQTTPDWVNTDHRRLAPIADGDLHAYLLATWELSPQSSIYVEAVHRLSISGAVVTHVVNGTSQHGFDAEWRTTVLVTFEGDKINRSELFDETELEAALARFGELQAQPRQLQNAASQVDQRFWTYFAARDWDAMADLVADDIYSDDRRRVVNGGVRHGRDAHIADMQAIAEIVDPKNLTSTVIATRGARLALCHIRSSNRAVGPDEITAEVLSVLEIDADNHIVANIGFDVDDIDVAFEELDARYSAGEAAAHAHTWSVIARSYSAANRREVAGMTTDSVFVDHRPGITTEAENLAAYLPSMWDLMPDLSTRIEAVHRLSDRGAVLTHAARGTTHESFDAEWRMICVGTVEGELINRVEVFDEADLDTALARFEELHTQAPRLENAASRADDRFFAHTRARNWAAMAEILADNSSVEDRRRVVNIGVWQGRDALIANFRALAHAVAGVTSTAIAVRGERLALTRICAPNRDPQQGDFAVEMLGIAELDTDGRLAAHVLFDPDDIDAAFEELDRRYVAGEAAPHAQTWLVVERECAAFNRHEVAAADYITVDHRPMPIIEAYSQAALWVWDVTPDFGIHIEAVHRLSGLGAVATYQANGTSPDGFDGEWRIILLLTVEGDRISRCEVFDEADLDAALARFDELDQPPLTQS